MRTFTFLSQEKSTPKSWPFLSTTFAQAVKEVKSLMYMISRSVQQNMNCNEKGKSTSWTVSVHSCEISVYSVQGETQGKTEKGITSFSYSDQDGTKSDATSLTNAQLMECPLGLCLSLYTPFYGCHKTPGWRDYNKYINLLTLLSLWNIVLYSEWILCWINQRYQQSSLLPSTAAEEAMAKEFNRLNYSVSCFPATATAWGCSWATLC